MIKALVKHQKPTVFPVALVKTMTLKPFFTNTSQSADHVGGTS